MGWLKEFDALLSTARSAAVETLMSSLSSAELDLKEIIPVKSLDQQMSDESFLAELTKENACKIRAKYNKFWPEIKKVQDAIAKLGIDSESEPAHSVLCSAQETTMLARCNTVRWAVLTFLAKPHLKAETKEGASIRSALKAVYEETEHRFKVSRGVEPREAQRCN